jgi:acyl carrier protein
MTEAEILRVIVEGLRQIAPESDPERLRGDQPIRAALDVDSFDFLTFLVGLHKSLGVEIPEADYGQLGTLDGMVRYLQAKLPP